jgi:hypothetical protein
MDDENVFLRDVTAGEQEYARSLLRGARVLSTSPSAGRPPTPATRTTTRRGSNISRRRDMLKAAFNISRRRDMLGATCRYRYRRVKLQFGKG